MEEAFLPSGVIYVLVLASFCALASELYQVGLAVKSLSQVSASLPEGLISPERSFGTALTPLAPGRPMNMMASMSASFWRLNISIALEVLSKTTTLPHFAFAKLIIAISWAVSIW